MPEPVSWQAEDLNASGASNELRFGGDEWHDLRLYTPGDALSQVHWRKASGELSDWRVKRFAFDAAQRPESVLRVDLRMPSHAEPAAFERLLGRVWFWVLEQRGDGTLFLGQEQFAVTASMQSGSLQRAIAAAAPEASPAAGDGGLLLAVSDER